MIGARTRVQSHAFVCELVTIGEDCFVGHGVMFINDTFSTGGPAGGRQRAVARDRDRQPRFDRLQRHHHAGQHRRRRRDRRRLGGDQGHHDGRNLCRQSGAPAADGQSHKETPSMPVPYADLQLQYQTIKHEIDGAIAAVIRNNAFIRGPLRRYVRARVRGRRRGQALRFLRQRHRRALSCDGGAEGEAGRRGDHHGAFLDQHVGDDHPRRRHAWCFAIPTNAPSPSIPRRSRLRSRRARWASFPCTCTGSRRIWTRSWRSRASTSSG